MPSILNTGLSGLLAFQRALATTSHNISNVHTEGYSRQRVDLVAAAGQPNSGGVYGRGTQIAGVSRIGSQFVEARLTEAVSEHGRTGEFAELSARLSDLLGSGDAGVGPLMERFFAAVQEVANDPADPTPRRLLLSEGESLAAGLRTLDAKLVDLSGEMNSRIEGTVADINALAEDLAALNGEIVIALGASQGAPPNDLLDQRQQRLNQLAELTNVRTVVQDNGALNVFAGNGQPLVVGTTTLALTTRPNPGDPTRLEVALSSPGQPIMSEQLSGGRLGAMLDFRRDALTDARNGVGRVATVLAETFNAQHRRGLDADGNLGQDFFATPAPSVQSDANNAGAASVSVAIADASALQASNYRLQFDGAQFTLTRLTDGVTQTGAGPFTMDGVDVAIAGAAAAGDSFLIQPVTRAAGQFQAMVVDPDLVAAADPVTASATLANGGDGFITGPSTLDPGNPALLDSVDIVFDSPPATFDVIDVVSGTPIASNVAFTAGAPIAFNGWSTRIDGQPAAGDSFRVQSNVGGVGDNRNALALGALQGADLVNGKANLTEAYGGVVGAAGVNARQAGFNAEARERLLEDAVRARENLSGVSLDEEAVDLTRYQQAYQAMAQVVQTSNTLFDSVLAALR